MAGETSVALDAAAANINAALAAASAAVGNVAKEINSENAAAAIKGGATVTSSMCTS